MRKNLYQPVLINTTLALCSFFALYGLIFDLRLIAEESHAIYISGRLVTVAVCFLFLYQVNILKKQYDAQVPLIYALMIAYCIQGQYFVNGYYMAFMQVAAGFSLFFSMPKRYYYPLTWVGTALMVTTVWFTLYSYSDLPAKAFKFNLDASIGMTLISIVCSIGYQKMTFVREQKRALSEKFLDVGRYFGNFVHELKGVTSSPTVYIELLSAELAKDSPRLDYLKEIVANLKGDICNLNQKVLSINHLSRNSEETGPVQIKAVIRSIEAHFFSKDKLRLEVIGETDIIYGNEFAIRSIILNLLNNSKENFLLKGISDRPIRFEVSHQKVVFKDSGRGFPHGALRKINQDSFFSEKNHGSGMGLFIIREYMKEFGGKALFKNRTDDVAGVQIELHFGQK